jgi:hypothetical protein
MEQTCLLVSQWRIAEWGYGAAVYAHFGGLHGGETGGSLVWVGLLVYNVSLFFIPRRLTELGSPVRTGRPYLWMITNRLVALTSHVEILTAQHAMRYVSWCVPQVISEVLKSVCHIHGLGRLLCFDSKLILKQRVGIVQYSDQATA